ncbi:MAG: hypothetical protein OEW15_17955 [Nitrospirota bacterium]|nr:hypothetical protein [Nitrospirota bacterium]
MEAQNYEGIFKDDLIGDILYTTIATYFGILDIKDDITARSQNIIRYRAVSLGYYSLQMKVQEMLGVPLSIKPAGMMMDAKKVTQAVFSGDGDMAKVINYMRISGAMSSAMEHSVPELIYSSSGSTVQGISTIKALRIANTMGIPIYTIGRNNIDTILPQLQITNEAKIDILNAVNAGKQVTVSKSNINFNGWTGCGYIIIDPESGGGAYMISGSVNGGWCDCAAGNYTFCEVMDKINSAISWLSPLEEGFKFVAKMDFVLKNLEKFFKWMGNISIGLSALLSGIKAYNQTGGCLNNTGYAIAMDLAFSALAFGLIGLTIGMMVTGPGALLAAIAVASALSYALGEIEQSILDWMNDASLCS